MPRTFIFDIDGVMRKLNDIELNSILSKELFEKYHDRYSGMSLNEYLKMCYKQNPVHKYHDLGYYSDEEYLKNTSLTNGEPLEVFKYVYAKKCEFDYNELIPCSIELTIWLRSQGCKVYALSNMSLPLSKKLRALLGDYFDDIVFSCDCHLKKPDKEIYEFALSKWKESFDNCVFIDDVKANLETFSKLGGKTYLFITKNAEACTEDIKKFLK